MKIGASYIPPHQPCHIESDMKYMKQIGCDQVLFALQENHFQWLNGSVRFGPQIAKDHGLFTRAVMWGYANTSGGGRSSRVMLENPDMWRCNTDGRPFLGGYPNPKACHNNPKTISFFGDYVCQCREFGFDSIMIDEPTVQDCFCEHCRELFYDRFKMDLEKSRESSEYKQFQYETTIEFVKKSCREVKKADIDLQSGLCLMPSDRDKFDDMAVISDLDVFGTDPYWLRPINKLTFEDAVNVTKYARRLSDENGKLFELYLGCFGIDAGLEEKIYSGSKILIEEGAPDLVTAWSFRGGIGLGDLSSEECDNPQLAWDSIERLYCEIAAERELVCLQA
ncbi:MAG: hypothetical protein ACIAQZ_15595 [Sedimentisphaeraceae bacterium JB056]